MFMPLDSSEAELARVGGKGANLAILARAGFLVPGGFLITTAAYREFVDGTGLDSAIQAQLAALRPDDPTALERASAAIRAAFSAATLPATLHATLSQAYAPLAQTPVAVRSSATAEDLPDMSFAGQQDTFLNVVGLTPFLQAVVDCWSSLWTARAIGYRARNAIPHDEVALAVVVQEMVAAEVSGVLFSANPLTGRRGEIVIDATFGLGEALVSGQVEPDHYVVDLQQARVTERQLGSKALAIRPRAGGGLLHDEAPAGEQQALPDAEILALATLGQQIEGHYGFPQDVEWAYAGGRFYILQSRPITSLFPLPAGLPAEPLQILVSFGSIQGLLGPITPLGQDGIRLIMAGGATLFGYQVTHESQRAFLLAGERLWANMTPGLRHPLGSRVLPLLLPTVDPGAAASLPRIMAEPSLGAGQGRFRLSTLWRLARGLAPLWWRVFQLWRRPDGAATRVHALATAEIDRLAANSGQPAANADLGAAVDRLQLLQSAFPFALPAIGAPAGAGILALAILSRLSSQLTGSGESALELTRGLPHNVTTAMDLALWQVAQTIQAEPETHRQLAAASADDLARSYLEGQLPPLAQRSIAAFLDQYGMRGPGEIDLGQPRWREEPTPLLRILQSYLQIEPGEGAPDVVFRRGEAAAAQALEKLVVAARAARFGWLKVRLIRFLARRLRALAGLRESPKFHVIQRMGLIRAGLLQAGEQLVSTGQLERADDLFFLYLNELKALSEGELAQVKELVARRRTRFDREARRQQVPRLLLSDGRAIYEGVDEAATAGEGLLGSPVSPGLVEGQVRVVLNPQQADLKPGEILVCPGTDPAWTPLFLAAGGLVMEVGGLMTHGAIVAREYGIPAVVGVHNATQRLQTGQRIRVDGSSGLITLVD